MSVDRSLRFSRSSPCPVCQGYDQAPRGAGKRCTGYRSEDGLWVRCSREEHAGSAPSEEGPTGTVWRHRMRDRCHCGQQHGSDSIRRAAEPEAIYRYENELGVLLYEVLRMPGKQFRQRRPDGAGGWDWRLGDVRRVPFRLRELLGAKKIWIVEGEKDALTLARAGHQATCCSGGTGGWRLCDWAALPRGVPLTIIADADAPGRKMAAALAEVLGVTAVLECTRGKDITDHLAAGGTLDELIPMAIATYDVPVAARRANPPPPIDTTPPAWLDDDGSPEPAARPQVQIGVDTHRVLDELDLHLARDPIVYQRAGELVAVVGSTEPGRLVAEGTPVLRTMTVPALLPRVTKHVDLIRTCAPSQKACRLADASGAPSPEPQTISIQPPPALLAAMLSRHRWTHIQPIRGIAETPIYRPDGTICDEPGYDAPSQLLYAPSGAYLPVAEHPTQDDARRALEALREVFADFPYQGRAASLVPISALLSILARAAIDGPVPAHIFDASVMGSGKTLQCDVVCLIATGRVPAHATWPARDEEREKLLSAYALACPAAVVLDNVREIGGGALEQTLTSEIVEFRRLGGLVVDTVPWRAVVLVSGNNLSMTDDMIRRSLLCRLVSPLADPTRRRDFAHPDLIEWVRSQRPRLVHAALTILRAYAAKGRPDTGVRLASYASWAKVVAGSIVYAGGDNVTDTQPPPERAALDDAGAVSALIDAWSGITTERTTVRRFLGQIYPAPGRNEPPDGKQDVRDAIESLVVVRAPSGPDPIALSKKLNKFMGRWFGDRCMKCQMNPHTKVLEWWVEVR